MGDVGEFVTSHRDMMLTDGQHARFDAAIARELVKNQFGDTLRAEVLEDKALVSAVGAVLSYLIDTEKSDLSYIKELNV